MGYEIYDSCNSYTTVGQISNIIASKRNIVGVAAPDFKDFVKFSAQQVTSFNIPTFTYVYNDNEMMNDKMFPSLFSLTDTEQVEGDIIISFLKLMNYRYVDIWYHKFSKDMAMRVYEKYVSTVESGCGRIEEVSNISQIVNIDKSYGESGGSNSSSQVQLILSNSRKTTVAMIEHMTEKLNFKNKIYIFGISNGRKNFLQSYISVFKKEPGNTLILPLAALLNAELKVLEEKLKAKETSRNSNLDKIEEDMRDRLKWYEEGTHFDNKMTSWMPYVVGGVKILTQSLYEYLVESSGDTCMDHLREVIFETLINRKTKKQVLIDDALTIDFSLDKRVVTTGYEIGVYQSTSDSYSILGKAFSDSITVSNSTLLNEISDYNQTCSESCRPGFYSTQKWNKSELSCCWNCRSCDAYSISTAVNSAGCTTCKDDEAANDNNTECNEVEAIYIDSNSPYFIGGLVCAGSGLLVVIVFGVIVVRHKDRASIRASDTGYLYVMLVGLAVGFITSVVPMLEPHEVSCRAEYFGVMAFATLVSTNLALKCNKIYEIFRAANSFETPRCGWMMKKTLLVNMVSLLFALTLAILDVLVWGPSWIQERLHKPHNPYYLVCQSDHNHSFFILLIPLILPAIAFVVALVLAFKMRNFPHNFRETLNIFAATLIALLCCIMFLTGYSLADNYFKGLLRAIVTFVTSLSFLLCIFLPKIYFLFKNHKEDATRRELKSYINRAQTIVNRGSTRTVSSSVTSHSQVHPLT